MKKRREFNPDWVGYRQGLKDGRAEALSEKSGLTWRKTRPIPADLNGHPEEYFWARDSYFKRPMIVRAKSAINSDVIDGQLVYRAEVYFQFFVDGFPHRIWSSKTAEHPWLLELEWAGPVERACD